MSLILLNSSKCFQCQIHETLLDGAKRAGIILK